MNSRHQQASGVAPASVSESPPARPHFYSLDVLRGLAALLVVVWHWQHFYYDGTVPKFVSANQQPFYSLLRPFYTEGYRAVELFFSLSGFIFFWLYSDQISRGKVTLKTFAILRLSRLYPLHIATLVLVALGQFVLRRETGYDFVFGNNDAYHFLLQLGFASNWGFERGFSYNGPIWSVSVECLMYGAFFLLCRVNLVRWWHLIIWMLGGYFTLKSGNLLVAKGVLSFFAGGLSHLVFSALSKKAPSGYLVVAAIAVTAILWFAVPLETEHRYLSEYFRALLASEISIGKDLIGRSLSLLSSLAFELVLFPATIITLALAESKRGTLGKRLGFLGAMSYSSYLVHFPLQLAFYAGMRVCGVSSDVFLSAWCMVLFFSILIPLSLAIHHGFERPMQSLLRSKLLVSDKARKA